MQTYSFTEAVQILEEGKCEGILPEIWRDNPGTYYKIRKGGMALWNGFLNEYSWPVIMPSTVLGKWILVGKKPRTEKRVIEYWIVAWEDRGLENQVSFYLKEPGNNVKAIAQVFHKTFTYTYTFSEEK